MIVVSIAAVVAVGTWFMTFAAARGTLAANGLIGLRTPATQRSEKAWRNGHRAALPVVALGGALVTVGALLAIVVFRSHEQVLQAVGLGLLGAEAVALIIAVVVAHRAALASSR